MRKISTYQQNFSKGEMDPQLHGSPDLAAYYEGLDEAKNVWISATGSAEKRYGMRDVATFEGVDRVKLIPFTNSRGTHFLLVAMAGKIEIFHGATTQHLSTITIEILTKNTIENLYYAAYEDSLILTEETIPPQQLKWNGNNNFTITSITFNDIPSYEFIPNDIHPNTTLTPSAKVGYITCTTAADVFQSSDVGKYIAMLPLGRLKITKVDGARVVTGFLEEELYDTTAVPSGNWTLERGWEPLWGQNNSYPAVCEFHEGRLILANFPRARTAFAFSVVDAPFNFATGDGSAIYGGVRKVSSDQSNAIFHIISLSSLYIFCANSEFIIDQNNGENLHQAPIKHDSSRGCVRTIRPVEGEDGGVYFFQPDGIGISEFRYFFERASYEAHSFSKFCGHLLKLPHSATLWKGDENFEVNILFFVNADGSMISGTIKLVEKIMAFTRVECDLPFSQVCAVERDIFCTLFHQNGSTILRHFIRGYYADNETPYLSAIKTLPINSPDAPYFFDDITTTGLSIYVSGIYHLEVDKQRVYSGPPFSGRIRHYSTTSWNSHGSVTISDGTHANYWKINNIGRSALVGGIDQ